MAKLTKKQELFVKEYLIDLNATAAAKRAGYSEKTAAIIGNENLKKPYIQAAIEAAMKKRSQKTEVTAENVLAQLAKIAFSDIKQVMEWETVDYPQLDHDGQPLIDEEGNERVTPVMRIRVKPSEEVDGTIIQEVSETNRGGSITHTVKMNDRMKALELLGKHLGMFTDKVDLTGDMNVNIQVDYGEGDGE